MTERGMIFNGEMVRAILDGRKTQTRRIMKLQPKPSKSRPGDFWFSSKKLESMVHVSDLAPGNSPIADYHLFIQEHCCPFGAVGDRIWVRETWARYNIDQNSHDIAYRATTPADWPEEGRWRPSIHMPRWASRILLEITSVRVERLNAISEEDAEAEGIDMEALYDSQDCYDCIADHNMTGRPTVTGAFKYLWESIYGEEGWKFNPWVWVIEFKRVEGGAA
ncbi:morphogenetic protein [Escherichia coli]|nr:morphogenetic protein [Escherichia coli]